MEVNCPHCAFGVNAADGRAARSTVCPRCRRTFDAYAAGQTQGIGPGAELVGPRSPVGGAVGRQFEEYRIVGELGRGGMGVVYKAVQETLNRPVALKMILAGERASEDEIRRFLREAAAAAKLRHPNIVTVHELDVHEGIYYYTMEYLVGHDLGRLIDEDGMEPRRAVIIALKVARALAHAHGRGIIHRDLKPGNIIIGESDEPVLTDFGLAFDLRQAPDGAAPLAAGTPGYMAPEQVTGQHDRIGPATDIYSLGAVFYEMLTGRPPFTAATAKELFELVLDGEPEDPCRLRPGLDSDLAAIGMRCLRKKPEERYGSAAELAEVLVAWLSTHPKAGRP